MTQLGGFHNYVNPVSDEFVRVKYVLLQGWGIGPKFWKVFVTKVEG